MEKNEENIKAEKNRQAVKKCMEKKDRINVILPKGTVERIHGYGFSANSFCREVILQELARMDEIKKLK